MFKGHNNACMFFHAGCNNELKEDNHCESRTCPLLRDLNLQHGDYNVIAHTQIEPWPQRRNVDPEMKHKADRLREKLERQRDKMNNIELVISAKNTNTLNDILSDVWKWGFRIVEGSHRVDFHKDGFHTAVLVIIKGPKGNEDRVKEAVNRSLLNVH